MTKSKIREQELALDIDDDSDDVSIESLEAELDDFIDKRAKETKKLAKEQKKKNKQKKANNTVAAISEVSFSSSRDSKAMMDQTGQTVKIPSRREDHPASRKSKSGLGVVTFVSVISGFIGGIAGAVCTLLYYGLI